MKFKKPISDKNLMRLLLAIIVILALIAGYFKTSLALEEKKYKKLENLYVRVRSMLGREETQRLIDLSYEGEL